MKRFMVIAALIGFGSAVPALASEPVPVQNREQAPPAGDQQPVTLSDQQLDAVSGGDLLGLNLNLSALDTLNASLSATVTGLNAGAPLGGILGGTTQQAGSTVNGLLGNLTGVLGNLGL